jgi:hypothetical protein
MPCVPSTSSDSTPRALRSSSAKPTA